MNSGTSRISRRSTPGSDMPSALGLVSHVKIILPMIIVNININPCLCVLAIFSSVSQNKISHHSYEKALANTNAVVLSKTSVMKRIQQMSLKGDKKTPSRFLIMYFRLESYSTLA